MSKTNELVFWHLWAAAMLVFYTWAIKGDFADRTYDWRKKFAPFLLPGRLKARENWVRQQKAILRFSAVFVVTVYILGLIAILKAKGGDQ
jgi:hypothetical protein